MIILAAKRPYSGLFGASKRLVLLMKWPQEGPQRSETGSVILTLLTLASWTIMRWLELNLVPYKTSRGAKSALKGSSRPLLAPLSPPKPPRMSPKPPQIPSVNLHNPSSYLITHWFSQNHPKMQNKNKKFKNSPKLQKTAQKRQNWKSAKMKIDLWSSPIMSTDQKIY